MHADFEGFEGAEEEVGDEFGAGGGSEEDEGFRGVGEELLAVVVLEGFVCTWKEGKESVVEILGNDYGYALSSRTARIIYCTHHIFQLPGMSIQ